MRQSLGEVPVIGEDQQPRGVGVQPPDVKESFLAVCDDLAQIGPAILILHRADDAARLVEHKVGVIGRRRKPLAIDPHDIGQRIDPSTHLGDHFAVDLDPASRHVVLAAPPARDT